MVELQICAAEAIDGLLLVAHRGEGGQLLARHGPNDAQLQRVCVLEFVHHDHFELVLVLLRQLGVLLQQLEGAREQVVGVHGAHLGLERLVALQQKFGQGQEQLQLNAAGHNT